MNKLHLGYGQVCQVDVQIPEGSWREGEDQSRKPSWKKGDNRDGVNLGQNPNRLEGALLGEVGEDEGPLFGYQLVLLHPELL